MIRRIWEGGIRRKLGKIEKETEKKRIKEEEEEKEAEKNRKILLDDWTKRYRAKGYDKREAWKRAQARERLEKAVEELNKIVKLTPRELLEEERRSYLTRAEQYERDASRATEQEKPWLISNAEIMRAKADELTPEAQLGKAQLREAQKPPEYRKEIKKWEDTAEAKGLETEIEEARKKLVEVEKRLKEYL
jgi:hypothetical protein